MNNETIVITQSRAGWLMFNGFGKVTERLDWKDRNRVIYIFNDSPKLRETMSKYNQFKANLL
ncbi:hypothetical protein QJ48_24760 [Paenibacillus sp. A3]|uniref:hypothetical protein n=1 Tax=Paenibacillus sp. A3 TaxID=1337054 RepID=UPI0006D59AC3|nr:hypothetical protein [Paenibacillus sp. A3]KPV56954.1 hypothetical protein QJ48_24760 [Paenibacillus sp. A3]